MKKEERDESETCSAGAGRGESAGESFSPSDLEDEKHGAADEPARPAASVPIGRPVSEAEYGRLKERAERETRPSTGGSAHEDSSGRKPDDG